MVTNNHIFQAIKSLAIVVFIFYTAATSIHHEFMNNGRRDLELIITPLRGTLLSITLIITI